MMQMAPEIFYGIGAALLLVALVWGTIRYRQRSPAEKQMGDRKARELFRQQN
jgi:hypothetical protein